MTSHHCYLCASDEGILLDIFADGGKTHCGKIETCLSVKIQQSDATSAKICHKCAYELDACSIFVQKFRETRDVPKAKSKYSKSRCNLCCEPGIKGYIFELGEGTPLQNSLRKIREIFDDKYFKDQPATLSICLNCRYNLDVLFDLKCIHQATLEKLSGANKQESKTTEYPKTKTSVVRRKTTYIPLPQLNGDKDYETDSSTATVMSVRRKRGRPRKDSIILPTFRICEQCNTNIENGIDMYRYHRTGRTVCKDCWLTMDPEKVATNKRRKLGLVLKDVLSNPSKYKSIYKVEKDEHGNTTFLITDDSSESEEKEKTPVKRTRRGQPRVKSPIKEEKEEEATLPIPEKKKPLKRSASAKSSEPDEPPAKVTVRGRKKPIVAPSASGKTKTENGVFTSDSEVFVRRTRGNSTASSKNSEKAASLSDVDSQKPLAKKIVRLRKTPIVSPISPPKNATITTRTRRAAQKIATVTKKAEETARPMRRTRANSLTSQIAAPLTNPPTDLPSGDAKSLSESGSPPSKMRNSKTKSLSPKNAKSDTETESLYSCGVCKIEYKNKLIGMAHELSHAKQPEVKLQRVAIPEIIVEEAPAEISLVEESEEQSHDISSTSDHKSTNVESAEKSEVEDPMETESITVDKSVDESKEKPEDSEIKPIVEDKIIEDDEKIEAEEVNSDNEKSNEKDENEDKTETPVVRELETSEENKRDDENIVEEIDSESVVEKMDSGSNAEKIDGESNAEKVDGESNAEKIDGESNAEKIDGESNAEKIDGESNAKKIDGENNAEKIDSESNVEKIDNKSNVEKIDDETDADIVGDIETKETSPIPESMENSDKAMEETPEEEKSESTPSEIIAPKEKEVENAEIIEEPLEEETAKESTETPVKANGFDVEHEENSETNDVEKVEKIVIELDNETDCRVADACRSEENIEGDDALPVTSETPEKEIKDTNPVNDEEIRNDEITAPTDQTGNKTLETTLEIQSTEVTPAVEDAESALAKESESISVVTEVLREVFDLATAEVQKRLDSEKPNDEKSAAPVAETLENISLEIQNSADMPSLEPLTEEQTAKNQS